ncbi:MAG: hypothetical protein ABJC13_14510 [Acidobacteriota bacterium]
MYLISRSTKELEALRMRDDFSAKIKAELAHRVANHCSNEKCRKQTCGPALLGNGVINVGVAAHITSASPGGPRYHPEITASQRKSAENAIWLCQTCAKLIDSDVNRFPETILRSWKQLAEETALSELDSRAPGTIVTMPQRPWVVIDEYFREAVEHEETGQEYTVERVRIVNLGLASAVNINIPKISIGDRSSLVRGPFQSLQPGEFIHENVSNFNASLQRALLEVPMPSQGPRSLRIPFVIEYRGIDHRLWTTEQEVAYSVFGITFPVIHPNE